MNGVSSFGLVSSQTRDEDGLSCVSGMCPWVPLATKPSTRRVKLPMRFRAKRCLPGLPAPRLAGSGLCY